MTGTGTTSKIEISDTGTGDAGMNFNVGGANFSIGMDYSDGQSFKVSSSNTLGTQDRLRIDRTTGETTITTTAGTAPLTLSVPVTGGHYLNVTNGTVNTQYGVVATSFSAIGTSTNHDMVMWANGTERIRAKAVGGVDVTGTLTVNGGTTITGDVTVDGAQYSNVVQITAGYTILSSDHIINMNGGTGGTVTLPDAVPATAGRELIFIVQGGAAVWSITLAGASSDNFLFNGSIQGTAITMNNQSPSDIIVLTLRALLNNTWAVASYTRKE